ncbi:hypothetical protein ACFL46_03230 [Candidatus Neomarinimicrobiota bacterium]
MNTKRFILAAIVVFITLQVTDYIIHNLILSGTYESLMNIWRADMMGKMWVMQLASLFFSFMFVFIFTKNYEGNGVSEGIRYGLLIGLLMSVMGNLSQYSVYPLPFSLVLQWFFYGMIQFILAGAVASLVYKQ